MCISDCSRITNCKLISYNIFTLFCKYYNDYLQNETELSDASNNFVYSYEKPNYELKGIRYNNFTSKFNIISLVQLQNGIIAFGTQYGWIGLLDPVNLNLITFMKAHESNVKILTLLQNGNLASGSGDNTIRIWSPMLSLIKTLSGHNDAVTTLKVLNNGNVASGSFDSLVKIWNPEDGSLIFNLTGHTNFVNSLIQLKSGDLISFGFDAKIIVWNPYKGSLIRSIIGDCNYRTAVALVNDYFATGCLNSHLQIWDSNTLNIKYTLSEHNNGINNLVQLQNGYLASCSGDKTIKIWDLENKSLKYNLSDHSDSIWGLIVLTNGYLASAGTDNQIIIWQ